MVENLPVRLVYVDIERQIVRIQVEGYNLFVKKVGRAHNAIYADQKGQMGIFMVDAIAEKIRNPKVHNKITKNNVERAIRI